MASSGWQGDVTLTSGGFGYNYFKGNLRIDSISHSGDTVYVSGAFGVHNTNSSGYSNYYYPINAAVNGSTGYQQVVAGYQNISGGQWVTSDVSFSFSASAGSTSKNIEVLWSYNNGTASNSKTYTLYFDAAYTAPSGLTATLREVYPTGAKIYTSVSSMGNPSSATGRYVEAAILGSSTYGQPYKYLIASNTSASNIVVNNGSVGSLTIVPNTQYYYGGYANNTQKSASVVTGTLVTTAEAPTVSLDSVTAHTATINFSTPADGGKYPKNIQYSLDGTNWVTGATISSSSASVGSYVISGLNSGTNYDVRTRVNTTAGSTNGSNIQFRTDISSKLYGSAGGETKRVKKLYGSVGGVTKKITKVYGSVNGAAKLIYEEEA